MNSNTLKWQIGDWCFFSTQERQPCEDFPAIDLLEPSVHLIVVDLMKQDGPSVWQWEKAARRFNDLNLNANTAANFFYGGGGAGDMFTALVENLAIMAFTAPGGVRFNGYHFEVWHWGDYCGFNGGKDRLYWAEEIYGPERLAA